MYICIYTYVHMYVIVCTCVHHCMYMCTSLYVQVYVTVCTCVRHSMYMVHTYVCTDCTHRTYMFTVHVQGHTKQHFVFKN